MNTIPIRHKWEPYLWLLPSLLLMSIFVVFPIGIVFKLSLSQISKSGVVGGWYGLAKRKEAQGWQSASRTARILAVIFPALVHGAYDYIATNETDMGTVSFIVFVIIMFVICFYTVRRLSTEDKYIDEE